MDKPTPTRQQRDIISGLSQTLGAFGSGHSPYPDARPADPPPTRRKNPRALIVAASRIRTDPAQVRRADRGPDAERVLELARSIAEVGLQQPPGVREEPDGYYRLVYGEGRFTAMVEVLGWPEVEVIRVDAKDEDLIWHQLHENIHRTNLSPLDLADAVRQAQGQGFTLAQIAARMSKSESWVQKALTVGTRLTDEAKRVLAAAPGRPAMESVYAVAQVPPEAQAAVAREVADGQLSRVETEKVAAAAKKAAPPAADAPKRTGRKKKGKPFEATHRAANGASVTVRFRKADADPAEVAAALEEVLAAYRRQAGKSVA